MRWLLRRRVLTIALALVVVFLGTGWIYQLNAERTHQHIHDFGDDGTIVKAREVSIERGSDRLVVLVHGFGASPMAFQPVIDGFRADTEDDLWAPLLRYHGRTLREFRAFDAAAISADLLSRLRERAGGYREIVLIGHSFGGAILAQWALDGALPPNSRLVLFAPAIKILQNTRANRLLAQVFRLWSSYCDFSALGCTVPGRSGTDPAGVAFMYAQNIFFTIVADPLLELFSFASALVGRADALPAALNIVIARNDNDVDAVWTADLCARLTGCRMHVFPYGGHLPQFGALKADVASLLERLAADPGATCAGLECSTLSYGEQSQAKAGDAASEHRVGEIGE